MNSTKIDVAYVARLACLKLTPEEQTRFQGELNTILAYVAKIGDLDVSGIEPTSRGMSTGNVLRDDSLTVPAREIRERLLANAPERIGDEFKVPRILE